MAECSIVIDDKTCAVPEGTSVLEACRKNGFWIPTLCHEPRLEPYGGCRMCLVEVEGVPDLVASCVSQVRDKMVVRTATERVLKTRRAVLELILSDHPNDCLTCEKDGDCDLQNLAFKLGVKEDRFGMQPKPLPPIPDRNPMFERENSKCILCGRCVRMCDEVQMAHALAFGGRGMETFITTPFGKSHLDDPCVLCGLCVSTCPTGALIDKHGKGIRARELTKVRTTCTYCGVGCQLDLNVNNNRVIRVTSEVGCVPNDGNLCVKGQFAHTFIHHPDRLTHPLIRENDTFRKAGWEEVLLLVGKRLAAIRDKCGPDGIAFLSSSRCTNEENYLMQKLARTAGRTNNIDQCATTCHGPSVAGLGAAFGSGSMTNSIAEIKNVQTLFVIGCNATEAHPIVGLEMKKAIRKGARLIVCDPRATWLAQRAHIHIKHRPGTDNMLVNAMMNYIIEKGLHNKAFIDERCEQFEAFRENLRQYSVEKAAEVCGVPPDLIRKAAEWYAAGTPSAIFYTLGITEHTCGTENVQNMANLAMLCGHIGKPSSGVNPLRGQNNVQGACDMGAIHMVLPGYQKVADPAVREKFAKAWGIEFPTNTGGRCTDFYQSAGKGVLKGFYVMGEDPALSEPNTSKLVSQLKNLEFLVCQEIFMSETAKLAHVVLPASCFAEKDGTFTNTERRVQRVRKAVDPPGQARADWRIICDVATAMGYPMSYSHPGRIFDEMASLTPYLAGISYDRIDKVGLQWPCRTPDDPGTPFLHKGRFTRGKGLFHVIKFRPPAEIPDAQYPLILSTGRTLYNYNIGNMTRKSDGITLKEPQNFVEINVEDAGPLGIRQGDNVRVITRRGDIVVRAEVGHKVRPGALWMPFHFVESQTNRLTHDAFDNITRTGEYKACAARIEKAG